MGILSLLKENLKTFTLQEELKSAIKYFGFWIFLSTIFFSLVYYYIELKRIESNERIEENKIYSDCYEDEEDEVQKYLES